MLIEMARLSRDQRCRQQLAERGRHAKGRRTDHHPPLNRDRVATVVHRAVCEFTRSDGFGRCAYYAVAGSALVSRLSGLRYLPQAGDVYLYPDEDYGVMMDACLGGFRTGEYHCWIAGPGCRHELPRTMEIIDLSSRHYRGFVEATHRVRPLAWKLPTPPDYVWATVQTLPRWLRVRADGAVTTELLSHMSQFDPLVKLVFRLWETQGDPAPTTD